MTVAHPEVVRESLARYTQHLESIQLELTPPAKTAADHLVRLLENAQRLGPDLSSAEVSFRSSDLEDLTNKDLELLMNQFVLGSGNDGAAAIFMGTEEAFFKDDDALDRSGLALGQYAWSVAWLTNSKPEVMRAIEGGTSKDFDAAAFHRHPYDVVAGGHSLGRTWGGLAKVIAAWYNKTPPSIYLEDQDHPRLGDLAYLIDRSAAPSKRALGGFPLKPRRLDFLEWLVGRLDDARVLLLYGSTGPSASDDWREANETLIGAFMGSTHTDEQSIHLGSVTIRWRDHAGRRAILSPALGGRAYGVGDAHREFIGQLIREAVPVKGCASR